MATPMPTNDMTVAEILERWPSTVPVFQELKTACVGCAMAPFDTMSDVSQIYDIDLSLLMASLHRVINEDELDSGPPDAGNAEEK
jgi:hybrid cluster-associated redox disulfide protein